MGGINNASDPDGHITEAFLRDSTREDQRRGMKLRADLGEAQLQIQSQASRGEGNPLREEHPDRNPLVLQDWGRSAGLVAHQHKILISRNFKRNNRTDVWVGMLGHEQGRQKSRRRTYHEIPMISCWVYRQRSNTQRKHLTEIKNLRLN